MARRVRSFDWATTPLGPIQGWPNSLKSALAICLRSPFQMAVYWGPELNCIYNDAERDILGNLHPRALGMPARELLRDSWSLVGPQLRSVIERGGSVWAEDQPLTFDRRGKLEISYFTYSYSPILADDGTVGGVLLITRETTARVLAQRRMDAVRDLTARSLDAPTAEEACIQSCSGLTLSADAPFALIYRIDDRRRRAICLAARAGAEFLVARRPTVDLEMSSDEVASLFREVSAVRSRGELVPAGLFVTPGANPRILRQRACVLPLARGASDPVDGFLVAGVRDDLVFDDAYASFFELVAVGIGRSVAAAGAREEERRQVSDIAALDRAKTDLFGNASHELRTPLALIIGHLEQLLEDRRLPERFHGTIGVAHRSALRMLKLVNALLDFSRLQVGQNLGAFQMIDVPRLTRDIAAMFQSAAQRGEVTLIVDCPSLDEPACVDPEAWERIVSNLISNALKFTPAGEVHVRTRAEDGCLCLAIEDTGIGIAPSELEHIFSRFYRSPDPRARAHAGSGIGLALVRELVQAQGGSIHAERRRGGGTRMTVRVPLSTERCGDHAGLEPSPVFVPQDSAPLFVAEANTWFEPETSDPSPAGSGPSDRAATADGIASAIDGLPQVLVVEDNADMREYLRGLLAPHFAVTLASDGNEAREWALRDPPNLLISDVMMPDMDGFALIKELRDHARTSHVPVILLSARADPESTLHALALGADDYIVKPFSARELLARVRTTLQNARGRSEAAETRGRIEQRVRYEGELRAVLNDLRAAQRRVAAAGDAERRRIERDLHDGAQQHLMAVRLELGLLEERLQEDPARALSQLADVRRELDEAVEELRELAHGLYPPLLATDGLEAALTATARRSPLPVTIDATAMTRAPRSIESTAYFCCLEALQNAAKHAGAGARAAIELEMSDGFLRFRISDDGAGFDPDVVRSGQGLINLNDRLNALGGTAQVTSSPGAGTTVSGEIPLP